MTKKKYGMKPWKENDFKELARFRKMLCLCLRENGNVREIIRKIAKAKKMNISIDDKKMRYYNK